MKLLVAEIARLARRLVEGTAARSSIQDGIAAWTLEEEKAGTCTESA